MRNFQVCDFSWNKSDLIAADPRNPEEVFIINFANIQDLQSSVIELESNFRSDESRCRLDQRRHEVASDAGGIR